MYQWAEPGRAKGEIARDQPLYGAGRKGEFRDWTNVSEDNFPITDPGLFEAWEFPQVLLT